MAISNLPASPLRTSAFDYDVAIVGLGHAGLVTALACYAGGRTVVGIDVSADRLITIGAGLADLTAADRQRLKAALVDDRFQMTADLRALVRARSVVICVPTPIDEYFTPDTTALKEACEAVVEHAQPGQVLTLTSATYVGCTEDLLVRPLTARGMEVGTDVFVAFSTDRIDPASAAAEHEAVPKVVGGATAACAEHAVETLHGCVATVYEVPSLAIAEMAKLLENTFRAVDIAIANEFADICRSMNIDITDVIDEAPPVPPPSSSLTYSRGLGDARHPV
ncbi:MAG: UDP-N-acetyl-D-glucosamine dehydrogenase [Nocardioidaceae bacterium]|jgi:nucleotide sugar dehydrogenase|nr:UDP-N-acetyl-D-glucosamine dehydrogenase [Nocardioidaceae bacterium]